jgi:hypothetical protein
MTFAEFGTELTEWGRGSEKRNFLNLVILSEGED